MKVESPRLCAAPSLSTRVHTTCARRAECARARVSVSVSVNARARERKRPRERRFFFPLAQRERRNISLETRRCLSLSLSLDARENARARALHEKPSNFGVSRRARGGLPLTITAARAGAHVDSKWPPPPRRSDGECRRARPYASAVRNVDRRLEDKSLHRPPRNPAGYTRALYPHTPV